MYGTKESGSNARSACSKVLGTHHRKCPLSASASASSVWWFPISSSFTTTRHGFPKPRHSKMEPAPACVMTRSEACISASRLGLKANMETSSPAPDTRFRIRPEASPLPNCTATEVNPHARRVATTFGRSSAASNASKDVVPTVTKRRLPLAATEVHVLLDAAGSVPAHPRPRGSMRARGTRGRLWARAREARRLRATFLLFFRAGKSPMIREKKSGSHDVARCHQHAATMPTFDMLYPESIADAVLSRDGDVARRLRAETGASVELLAPPSRGPSLFAFEPADALVARRVPPDPSVVVRVSCDDALSTALSCPAQTCLFRLHARLAAVSRDDAHAARVRRGDRVSRLRSEAPSDPERETFARRSFFRVLAPRGACDVRSVRERTGASVRAVPYDALTNTDLVVVDRHENCESCHVEAMRRVVARLGAFQSGKRKDDADEARTQALSRCVGQRPPPHLPTEPANDTPRIRERSTASAASFPAESRYARTGVWSESARVARFRALPPDQSSRADESASAPRRVAAARTGDTDAFTSVSTPRDASPTAVVHLPIPTSLVSAVVGRGGVTIQRVRAESGAKVKLHDGAPGAATRFLELGGERAKVQAARALVVQCLERMFKENPEQDETE